MSKEVKLTDILDADQLAQVMRIKDTTADDRLQKALLDYLIQFKQELADQGYDAGYLSWVLYAKFTHVIP